MHWLWPVSLGVAYLAAYVLGLWLARRRAAVVNVALIVSSTFIALRIVFYDVPALEYRLSVYYVYTLIQAWWSPVAAFVLLGIGTLKMTQRWRAILVAFCAWALFAILVQSVTARVLFDPSACTGTPGQYGLCEQTTDFTCGAAATSTLLAQYDVASTEREMALRCWTNYAQGTDRFYICKALHEKLADTPFRPRLRTADWDTLLRLKRPAMITVKIKKGQDHWVVVLRADERGVLIGDPDGGVYFMSRDVFLDQWHWFVIVLEPKHPDEPPAPETAPAKGAEA